MLFALQGRSDDGAGRGGGKGGRGGASGRRAQGGGANSGGNIAKKATTKASGPDLRATLEAKRARAQKAKMEASQGGNNFHFHF